MPSRPIDLDREARIRRTLDGLRADLAANPGLGARTRAMLDGELACPDLEALMSQEAQVSLRLPADVPDRADALVSSIEARPEYEGVRVSRSFVLRLAMLRGLAALEAEARTAGAEPREPAKPKASKRRAKGKT